jgi:hypothetical protein
MNIEENHCWYHLDIEVNNALKSDWKFPKVTRRRHMWGYTARDMLSQDWLSMMKKKYNLDINYVLLFYSGAYFSTSEAHVDIDSRTLQPCIFAMNWVIDCGDSKMLWYEGSDDDKELKITEETQTGYEAWDYRTLNEIDVCTISNKLTLVRVDLPHRTVAAGSKRWCISVRARNLELGNWAVVKSHFRSKNLLIDRD